MEALALQADTTKPRLPWRKIGFALWLVLLLLLVALHWYPIRFGTLRLVLVVDVLLLWGGALWLSWPLRTARRVLVTASLIGIVVLLLPAPAQNPQTLRQEYVRALESYTGTPYVWGGESRRGIDCSGLMRCALIDAHVNLGLVTLNPAAIREGFSLWWNDCSAKAMKEEFQGKTRLLFTASSLNKVNYSVIEPGDIAVTSNGVHVLAYIGNQTWIEADPNGLYGNRVIQVQTPTRNGWFNMPVHIMRWRQFEGGKSVVGSKSRLKAMSHRHAECFRISSTASFNLP